MLGRLLKLFSPSSSAPAPDAPRVFQIEPPAQLTAPGAGPFEFAGSLQVVHGLPTPDWSGIQAWVASLEGVQAQAEAWAGAEFAWLAHLQAALGPDYHLSRHEHALLLSPLEPRVASATTAFMSKTLARILRVLDGIAAAPAWGHDILVVFHDEETYYRYASRYYPEDGEFALSSGMHINAGCSHFVTFLEEMRTIEPVIAHEMTHACLAHLPIPAWLNEGLAVNTERRLCPPPGQTHTAHQLHAMHQRFWNADTIQQFWSGRSFLRTDDGNLLSYDLGRILAEQLARDWPRFQAFVLAARLDDAGNQAAKQHHGLDLGEMVRALFEPGDAADWSPRPAAWHESPERGAF